MSTMLALRPIGPTTMVSVGATSTTAQIVPAIQNDQMEFCAFLNTGATTVHINIVPLGNAQTAVAPAAVIPTATVSQPVIVLPPSMPAPLIFDVPNGFSYTAIGSAAGPSTVFITPIATQS
jgi:hypothetical protein